MRWIALSLVAMMLLAGCASDPDAGDPTGDPTGSGTSTTRSATTSRGPGAPPVGNPGDGTIQVSLNRTGVDGPAPLSVDFTLTAQFTGGSGSPRPTVKVTYKQTEDANGTALAGAARDGPTIASLPASFSLTFDQAGKWEVTATVKASGYRDGEAKVLILPRTPGGADGESSIFFDGAEGDTSQWTLSAFVTFIDFEQVVPTQETLVPHPTGSWELSDAAARTGTMSWYSDYPDNYRGRIVSNPIQVPGGGRLTFYMLGGAEHNCCDGLYVYVNDQQIHFEQGVLATWTPVSVQVPDGEVVLEFRMDADVSCSNETSLPAGCGEGYDAGGFYIDDITIE